MSDDSLGSLNPGGSSNEERSKTVPQPFTRILVGLDLSDETEKVLAKSAYLAKKLEASTEIVTVVNVPTNSPGNEMDGAPANQDERQLREKLISRVHLSYGPSSENIEVKVLHGDPAERISEYAEFLNSDLIVVGSRMQGALRRTLFGSVSDAVANRSRRSVLIIK